MWLKVNVCCPVADCFLHDFVYKSDDGCVFVFFSFFFGFICSDIGFIQTAGAYAEVLGNSVDHLFGIAEIPFRPASADCKNPAIHSLIREPYSNQWQGVFVFVGCFIFRVFR